MIYSYKQVYRYEIAKFDLGSLSKCITLIDFSHD